MGTPDTATTGPDTRPVTSPPVVGQAIAAARVAIGVAALSIPRSVVRWQLGRERDPEPARMFTRMLGTRDLALGAVTLAALDRGRPQDARRLVWLGAACDLVDGLATMGQPAMGRRMRRATTAVALLAAAAGAWQATQLPSGDGEDGDEDRATTATGST
jgi:hypothetical protein